jgi:hypothetical protein
MSSTAILTIETRLGGSLPAAYRDFLQTHESSHLLPNWLVRTAEPAPGGGPEEYLSALLTASDLLDQGLIGEAAEGMLAVGQIEPGGYLYLSVGHNRPGAFFARFPFQDPRFYLVAADFDDLRARSRPDPDG